jgi:hypothetical protein
MANFNIAKALAGNKGAFNGFNFNDYDPELKRIFDVGEAIGMKGVRHRIGDDSDPQGTHAVFATFPPGMVVPRHMHHCHRLEIIVGGSMVDEETGMNLTPGYVMLTEPNVYYGPHVAGPEGTVTVEIFSAGPNNAQPMLEDGKPFSDAFARDNHLDLNEMAK